MSGERTGSIRGSDGALHNTFRVGDGDMMIGDGHRTGERSQLGARLDRLSHTHSSVDISFGGNHLATITPDQLAGLSRMTSSSARLAEVERILRAEHPDDPSFDYAGNAVRVLNGISRVDTSSITEGSVLRLPLSAASNDPVEGNFSRGTPAARLGTIPATAPAGSLTPPTRR